MARTRYNLNLRTETYTKLQEIANEENRSVADLLRSATKLLMFVRSIRDDPDARLLVERKGEKQEIALDFI